MKFNKYTDVHKFHSDTKDILLQDENRNTILLGNILIGVDGKNKAEWRDPAGWFMGTVTSGDRIVLTALMTPPHRMTLYFTNNSYDENALKCLV
ncbi:MAG: hypothetical protein FWC95_08395, partial [Defluviitaleaceae bacterium]|nr:hypothetical protein [Defluviitaleaceae bacterium]